jgi:hypothetical protein
MDFRRNWCVGGGVTLRIFDRSNRIQQDWIRPVSGGILSTTLWDVCESYFGVSS